MIEPRTLRGGATALFEPIAGTKTLSLGFWFPFGSRNESEAERGFTHFIEHMLFKGTAKRTAAGIAREIDRLGGYLNAFTERENVCFYCTLPGDCAETAVDVLTDMIFSSLMPEGEFEKEKVVIVNEIISAEDDPEDISYDKFLKAIWPENSLSAKIAGEAEQVSAIGREALFDYYRKRFSLDRLLVCASGAFEPEKMREMLERKLDSVSAGGRDAGNGALDSLTAPEYRRISGFERIGIQQVQVYCGHPFQARRTSRDYNAFSVFNCAFGESMSSRLFQHIREDRGFCYSIYSFFAFAGDIGLWCVNGSTTSALFPKLRNSVLDEIQSACDKGMEAQEVEDAVLHLKGSGLMAFEDIEHRMKRLARQYYFNGQVLDMEEGLKGLSGVSLEDVNEIALDRLRVDELSFYAYGAIKTGRATAGMKRIK